MLPISEVHFAFYGIATVAATLGYACARRAALSLVSSNDSSKADEETGPPSLKRKLHDSDEHDSDTEEKPRPMKRNKTPPADEPQADEDIKLYQEWQIVVAPSYEQASGLRQSEEPEQDSGTPSQESIHNIKQDDTPARVPTPPPHPHPEPSSQLDNEKGAEVARYSTPQPPQANPSPNEPETPPTPPVTPHKPVVPAKIKPTDAFSAFSGSSSPFASYSKASGTSPFALSGQTVKAAPAWRRDRKCESDVFGQAGSVNALASSPNNAVLSATTQSPAKCKNDPGASTEVKSLSKSSTYLTGEEDETVDTELKGVKLFTKRGRKEFTDGMYGHIKILTRKSTPSKASNGDPKATDSEIGSRTRLLFRRDPLGQVSMNVGLHSTVRCHFEAAENILRVILMEKVTTDGENIKEDVVIYALKPGRAGKADFETFAKKLCSHEGLESRTITSVAAPGDDVAS